MDIYIYQADLYCADCGAAIRCKLDKEGKTPDITNEVDWDSDVYPKGPYPDGGGEADCPNHCACCGCFLENPLTPNGYNYVREALRAHLHRGSNCIGQWFDYYGFFVQTSESY